MHSGHRGRLVGKLMDGGVIYEHELLEILLFNACPRKDLNATAHALIARFGNIAGVLEADVGSLCTVYGVGRNMAEYLRCLGASLERCGGTGSFAVISNTAELKAFMKTRASSGGERVELLIMDKDGRVRRICTFYPDGGGLGAEYAEILKCLSVYRPYGLFAARTRTTGYAGPQSADDEFCETLYRVCKMCGCKFYDYCIAAPEGEIFSYRVADRLIFGAQSG